MSDFTPELGQMLFSNGGGFKHEMQDMVEAGIAALGYLLIPFLRDQAFGPGNPAYNNGGEFVNETFAFRAYCWCDGNAAGHEDGCPPNFVCGDFAAAWYKHVGRGNSQSRPLMIPEWTSILHRCIASLDVAVDHAPKEDAQ